MAFRDINQLTAEWERLKRQKSRYTGGVEGRVLLNLGFVLGEQYISHRDRGIYAEAQEDNKLYLVFNMIKPRLNKLLGRLSRGAMSFTAVANKKDATSISNREVVNKLDKALDQKLNQPARLWEMLWWCAVGGTAFVYTPWIPDATTELMPVEDPETGEPLFRLKMEPDRVVPAQVMQSAIAQGMPPEMFELVEEVQVVGEVGCEVYGPLNVFIDQAVRSVEDLSPDQMIFLALPRTVGWVERNFGVKVEPDQEIQIVTTAFHQIGNAVGGHFLKDLIPLVQGSTEQSGEQGEGIVTVVQGYAPSSEEYPQGRYVCFVPGKQILHDSPNPYEEIPFVDIHWQPVTTSFWTPDYVSDLIAPQRFLNKRLSQLGEQANASVYSQLLLAPEMGPQDIPSDWPGMIKNGMNEQGQPRVGRLPAPELPSWFIPATEYCVHLFNDISGAGDLFKESKFPGQLRGSEAIPLLQEILDTEWAPLFEHLGERLARVKMQRLNRVKQFYPSSRTMHYVDRDMKDETFTFYKEPILSRGTDYSIVVERSGLLPELRAVREYRLLNRLSGPLSVLYMDQRTGQLDVNKIAAELEFGEPGRADRAEHYRKLSRQIIEMIWRGEQPPAPLPFWDHRSMLDELESEMSTIEYLKASPQIQQLFVQQYEGHRQYIMQEAEQQARQLQQSSIDNAVAQATQQAAATAAARAVDAAMQTAFAAQQVPTQDVVNDAFVQQGLSSP